MNQQPDHPSNYELMVREFLRDYPEHIAGAARDPDPAAGKKGLCLDKRATLALMEWCFARGAYTDRAKLEANIKKFREELGVASGEGQQP